MPEHPGRGRAQGGGNRGNAGIPRAKRARGGQIDIGQHKDQMRRRHAGQTATGVQAQGDKLQPRQKADLWHDQRQIQQQGRNRRQGEQVFGLKPCQRQRQRQCGDGQGKGQGGGTGCHKAGSGTAPRRPCQAVRHVCRKRPQPRHRPQRQGGNRGQQGQRQARCGQADQGANPVHGQHSPAPQGDSMAQGQRQPFPQIPDQNRRQRQPQLHQRRRRGHGGFRQPRFRHPQGDLHRQGRRAGRPKDQPHVNRSHRIGQHRQHRQAQRAVEGGHHGQTKPCHLAIPHRPRHLHPARRVALRQGGKGHQQQKRHLFGDQAKRQADPPRIIQDQQIRRGVPSGGPRRQHPQGPPRGRNQECQPQCRRRMGYRQQRGQHPAQHRKAAGFGQAGQYQHRQRQRHRRCGQPGCQ